jgi:hypothetical protein
MVYLHDALSGSGKMSLDSIEKASKDFSQIRLVGQHFIPTVGQWSVANIASQWFLSTTVNMLPPSLEGTNNVHGGIDGLEGITHDHGHVNQSRFEVFSQVVFGSDPQSADQRVFRQMEAKSNEIARAWDRVTTKTLIDLKQKGITPADGSRLVYSIFFIVHEPRAFSALLNKIKSGVNDWSVTSKDVSSLAAYLRKILEEEHDFYPNLGTDYDAFEKSAAFWISHIGPQMSPDLLKP